MYWQSSQKEVDDIDLDKLIKEVEPKPEEVKGNRLNSARKLRPASGKGPRERSGSARRSMASMAKPPKATPGKDSSKAGKSKHKNSDHITAEMSKQEMLQIIDNQRKEIRNL